MGLKDDIFSALINNIQPDNTSDNFDLSDKAVDKVDTLAQDLTNAIVKFIQAQTFVVTELEASQTLTNVTSLPTAPGAPAVIPLINVTTAVSDKGQKPTNLKGGGKIESMKSKVQLKRAVEV